MYDKSKISEKVLKVEQSIEKEDKIKVLQSWYDNIKNYAGITEYEREYLVDAVEKKIRVKFPNKAKKNLACDVVRSEFNSLSFNFNFYHNYCFGK